MEYLKIIGETKLNGEVKISGAKNAALPLIAATILAKNEISICNMPDVVDINTLLKLIDKLGGKFVKESDCIKLILHL